MGNPLASNVLFRLGTVGLPSLPIDATRTYGHTLLDFSSYGEVKKWVDE